MKLDASTADRAAAALPSSPRTAAPDVDALRRWLAPQLPQLRGPCMLERIDGGQSNPTWILRGSGDGAWVLRTKPAPVAALPPSAHAIEREARVLSALRDTAVPVPRLRALCEDEAVIGVAFYVMDFVPGRVLRDATLPDVPAAERAAHHDEANRVLAALHAVDWRAAGLADYGRHSGFFARQAQRWSRQYAIAAAATKPIEAMERLAEWLPAHIPAGADEPDPVRLTHGDYRLENLLFHPTRPEVVAVLDWELSTLGHPLSDLAYHCSAWHLPGGTLQGFAGRDLQALGIPSEREYIARYCERVGRDSRDVLADWPFYLACNLFRLGAILAGIGARVKDGTATHSRAAEVAAMARPVAELGWSIASGAAPALVD